MDDGAGDARRGGDAGDAVLAVLGMRRPGSGRLGLKMRDAQDA